MSIPSNLTLAAARQTDDVLYCKLSPEILAKLVSAGGGSLNFGPAHGPDSTPSFSLAVGAETFATSNVAEPSSVDMYRILPGAGTAQYVGKVAQRITVRAARPTVASTSRLKSQNKELEREKNANKTTLIEQQQLPVGGKRGRPAAASTAGLALHSALSATASPKLLMRTPSPRSIPSSPALSTPRARTLQPTSKPLHTLSITHPKIRILHLLALGPQSLTEIEQRTNIADADLKHLLSELDISTASPKVALPDKCYKSLRIWDWKQYSTAQRQQVIADAKAAFSRLGVPADHALRQSLVEPRLRRLASPDSPKTRGRDTARDATADRDVSKGPDPAKARDVHPARDSSRPRTPSLAPSIADEKVASPSSSKRVGGALLKAKASVKKHKPTASASSSPSPTKALKSPEYITASAPKQTAVDAEPRRVASTSRRSLSPPRKAPLPADKPEDMFELAQKFKKTYSEYEKLYKLVEDKKSTNVDRQRLLKMHKNLESWKAKLWASVPRKRAQQTN